jgi:hypothetical protein
MPLIFDLGPIDALEAEAGHDLLYAADRLRDRMDMAQPHRLSGQGHVDRVSSNRRNGATANEPLLDRGEKRRYFRLGIVEVPSAGRPVTRRKA